MAEPPPTNPFDAYAPPQIAEMVEHVGVRKAALPFFSLLTLGVLAGAFIAFGAMLFTVVVTGSTLGYGPTRLLGGAAFSLGLVLVVVGGAELFTGNNLIVMAWAERRVTTAALLRNWAVAYVGNFIGAGGTALLMHWSGALQLGDGALAETALQIALAKVALSPAEAFFRGVLGNTLVCLAVWLSFAARTVTDKVLAVLFPVTAFVALGFEHSIANMYFVPLAMLLEPGRIGIGAFLVSNAWVTVGNIGGGSVLVALVYWIVYRRAR
ncbi:MAG: formate/nitrite transporter family protein [Alphaproteobacteria bacterium]|nr:formate/nitrite transporter family protein [Alphaproteobacteria bacterium]